MKQEQYTSASMFPEVVKHMMTAVKNNDLSDQELAQINEMCRDLQGMIKAKQSEIEKER